MPHGSQTGCYCSTQHLANLNRLNRQIGEQFKPSAAPKAAFNGRGYSSQHPSDLRVFRVALQMTVLHLVLRISHIGSKLADSKWV